MDATLTGLGWQWCERVQWVWPGYQRGPPLYLNHHGHGCTGLITTPDVACNVLTANLPLPCPNLVPKTSHLQLNTMPPQYGTQDPAASVAVARLKSAEPAKLSCFEPSQADTSAQDQNWLSSACELAELG
ncbi:hypothetical protein H4582DRAFT_2056073 [Lactarius indigo]|nr:hypothetical protein H4582DRAFT_2056073 [Lactarius indigo]